MVTRRPTHLFALLAAALALGAGLPAGASADTYPVPTPLEYPAPTPPPVAYPGPSYPGYYPEDYYPGCTPTSAPCTPAPCPEGQVGNAPDCHAVTPPAGGTKDDPTPTSGQGPLTSGPGPTTPGSSVPLASLAVVPAPSPQKPTVAFKGAPKASIKGAFSVACTTVAAPAGSTCRLRVVVRGKVIGTVTVKLTGDAARLRLKLSKKALKAAKSAKTVKVVVDLLGPKGDVILSTRTRAKLTGKG